MLSDQSLESLLQKEDQRRAGDAAEVLPGGLRKAAEETKREIRRAFEENVHTTKVKLKADAVGAPRHL